MCRRVWLAALLILCLPPGLAWGQVKLEWKFQEGDVFFVDVLTSAQGAITLNGGKEEESRTIEQKTTQAVLVRFKVQKKTSAGYLLEQKFELLTEKTSGAQVERSALGLFQAVKDANLQVTLKPNGEVAGLDGLEESLKKLAEGNKDVPPRLRQTFRADSLVGFLQGIFAFLPSKDVKEGDTWNRTLQTSLGPLGALEGRYKYTYQGKTREGERIVVTATLKYIPPRTKADGQPFEITGGTLQAEQVSGTILFDAQAGRLIRSEMKVHFKGELTIKSAAVKATIPMDQVQTVRSRMLAHNPLTPPRKAADN